VNSETFYQCKCQDIVEEVNKLLNHDWFHFYCGRCDDVVGKVLKSGSELNMRQDKLEEKVVKVRGKVGSAEEDGGGNLEN
jgi:hypothetical protein